MCISAFNNNITAEVTVDDREEIMAMTDSGSPSSRRRRSSTASSSSSRRAKRTYVEHNYQDHFNDPLYVQGETEEEEAEAPKRRGPRGGVVVPFPERLYNMLSQVEDDGFEDVVSWQPHGRCFLVHQPKRFVDEVMPKYFRQSKLTSFQRQVNLYGFRRLTAGKDRGAYYHELFLRGRPDLYKRLVRIRVKGTGIKSASSPATEPDFYLYQRCVDNADAAPKYGREEDASFSDDEEITPTAEVTSSSQFGDIQETMSAPPVLKPLSAPPPMMVTPPFGPLSTGPMSMGSSDYKKSSGDFSSQSMSLASMAKGIAVGSLPARGASQERPCPVTPEHSLRQLVSDELDQALALVSPIDSPMSSPFPSMMTFSEDAAATQHHEELFSFETQEPSMMDHRMDSFQEGIHALLSSDISDFEVDTAYATYAKPHSEDSLDPLFLLDEVTQSS